MPVFCSSQPHRPCRSRGRRNPPFPTGSQKIEIATNSLSNVEYGSPIGVPLTDLRPTQMTVGFREVEIKRRQWREADEEARAKLLRRHVVPAVVGPKGRYFIVDHHHFAKALLDEKAPLIAVYIVADLEGLAKDEFWTYLDNSDWCHAYDASGNRCKLSDIPRNLSALADDPFRSLVGELIRAGGCAKDSKPFFEFL